MSSSSPPREPYVVEDCRGVLQLMSDGTVRRSAEPAFPVDVPEDDCGVEWKDVTWEPEHDLNVRLYRPGHLGAANDAQIPVVAYFHGGGFCLGSGRWPNFHAWCLRLAAELPAVVLSFDYRLAPEHRLPAAQEDGAKAMSWLRADAAADPWLADAADFARVFIAGDSAGGNIAHHIAATFGKTGLSPPVRLRGYVLLTPAMAGEARTRAELECPPDAFLTTEMCDRYARLSLPEGATRDHPAINPAGPEAPGLEAVEMAPVLVVAAERDVLRDRNVHYAQRMEEEWGKDVEYVEFAGVGHGFFQVDPWSERADELVRVVRRFVVDHMDSE
ncbi:carboxylesterase 15-like [Phragmites australis]|uniref:carboxylesterase 15-like n=1 Tax=Phragmites australis TaxID=29695 RepID=UPI002D76D50B|nr:carboxylesterase 15-like [Phragmites australis]